MANGSKTMYIVAIQDGHGANMTNGDCLYKDYKLAEQAVKGYHAKGMNYIKLFYVRVQTEVPQWLLDATLAKEAQVPSAI